MKKFKDLTAADFPGVDAAKFDEWKQAVQSANTYSVILLVGLVVLNVILYLTTGSIMLGGLFLLLIFFHCSSTLVETMHFSARLSVATHFYDMVEVVTDERRSAQRAHDYSAAGTHRMGNEVPLSGAARRYQSTVSRFAAANLRRRRRADTERSSEQRPRAYAH